MLKLKHLFANFNAALMVVNYWTDLKEVPESFNYFRTAANAIYPFEINEQVYYLRMAPKDEKDKEHVIAELEFINYLKSSDYSVVECVPSKYGNQLEEVVTPLGTYYAVVFKSVPGKQLGQVDLTNEIVFNWGLSLGKLHNLSNEFNPDHKRPSWLDQFSWMREVLNDFQDENLAIKELSLLEDYFKDLEVSDEHYGLIHFDFEPDNVFYDEESGLFTPIDFDDSVYHWYVVDIERSLNSIEEEFPKELHEQYTKKFLSGYRSVRSIDEKLYKLIPLFARYANLYGYIRCLRSVTESWNHEPEWMISLRAHLGRLMEKRSREFGKTI
ncbi:phosphotransferase enzyme family protein [Haloplasma contractile]|uniref:Homoserine kinase type II protein n=1 Tax=Haloplasma contractile SSD-17B TaxID=1033810 RepID=F7Q121_9MOLU|nr:phosphotransferase [Haloplasma contractile]ERJ11336.1 homoserine kinase type II protein [Haloplasma contractile SSD-17B]